MVADEVSIKHVLEVFSSNTNGLTLTSGYTFWTSMSSFKKIMFAENMSQDLKRKINAFLLFCSSNAREEKSGNLIDVGRARKSWEHVAGLNYRSQVSHLQKVGYREGNLVEITESLVSKLKKEKK